MKRHKSGGNKFEKHFNFLVDADQPVYEKFKSKNDTSRFIQAACSINPMECLLRLTTSKHGLSVVQEVFSSDFNTELGLVTFIEHFRQDVGLSVSRKSHLVRLLSSIYQENLITSLVSKISTGSFKSFDSIKWMILQLLKSKEGMHLKYDASTINLVAILCQNGCNDSLMHSGNFPKQYSNTMGQNYYLSTVVQ